jgi:hypothetical protein
MPTILSVSDTATTKNAAGRYTTAEIIVHEADWTPPHNKSQESTSCEMERKGAASIYQRWNREQKVWNLPYPEAMRLGLESRIVEE